ncbi:hypothetical protein BsWGS_15924 [Bradybaena similaris]
MVDTQAGLSACSCHCSPVILSSLTRLPVMQNIFTSGDSYSAVSQPTYMPGAADSSFLCSPLGTSWNNIRDSSDPWRPLTQSSIYDPGLYPYRHSYAGIDLNGRPKKPTREIKSTNTLKAWLQEHLKNPYPTKGEKIMLAIITKMTLTQVSTWFANARRRLKKDNRISGSPRHRGENEGNDDLDDIFVSGDEEKDTKSNKELRLEGMHTSIPNHNHDGASSEPPSIFFISSNSEAPVNSPRVCPTPLEAQIHVAHDQGQDEAENGKRKIWSVTEFLNNPPDGDKHVQGLALAKFENSSSGDIFHKQIMDAKPGRPSVLCESHPSIQGNSCDNPTLIRVNSCDNQPPMRQPSFSIPKPCLLTQEKALGCVQTGVYVQSRHLVQRL